MNYRAGRRVIGGCTKNPKPASRPFSRRSWGCVLTTDAADRSRFWLLRCLLAAWRTRLGWISCALVLAFTWGGLWLAGWSLGRAQPVEVAVNSVKVLDGLDGMAGRTLRVAITVPPPGNCFRLSNHFLFSEGTRQPTFYALGSAMNGGGFRLRNGAGFGMPEPPGKPMDFVMMFSIPPSIPAGQYQYVYRSLHTCLWLGGLVQRRILYEAPPILVRVGPPDRSADK